jgi:predicted SAM-dependent methyltransferase
MATRAEILLEPISRTSEIIEIGPSYNPLAPKAAGWRTRTVDHTTREGLVAKYRAHPRVRVERIEEVDYVWTGGPLLDAIPSNAHGSFDAFLASHVIEHTPDFIGFLDTAAALLKPDGIVALAIPDKRFCFDYFQPLTTTGELLTAHVESRARHGKRYAFDHVAYAVGAGNVVSWGQHPVHGLHLRHTLEEARNLFTSVEGNQDYVDIHTWRFVPASFELVLLELARFGETDWRVERITPASGCEFFAWLRRGGTTVAATLSPDELAQRRVTLLKRTLLELRAQTDWLIAGDQALPTTIGGSTVNGEQGAACCGESNPVPAGVPCGKNAAIDKPESLRTAN